MARIVHLFKGDHAAAALAVITPQVTAGDAVTVAVLGATVPPPLPGNVTVHRVPDELSYEQLVELIFAAESVITW